ncbi:MAG: hypothetical protein DI586_04060 [Micavibrio aeruginosavorus]|uniref:Nucleoside-diphosphate sugar epimerase n=1 Tax=Micavibrio aeruginosavorus TaxID=349221 RepID=A0A2W5FK78_9BACT|nr:MAG: hypothetical protein DI586_04060 [Micavibrio aeruginosavorus]
MSTWIVTEGLIGTENQCLGVAESLDIKPVVKRIKLNEPWKTLSPYLQLEIERTFSSEGDEVAPPWPDLLIASGRKSIAASRFIKRKSGGKTFVVQIQDTRIARSDFDILAVPAHDPASKLKAANIVVTQATPNRITKEKLETARTHFIAFHSLPAPRLGVLIGGTAGKQILTADMVHDLSQQLKKLSERGYGLMITTSRRTGDANKNILQNTLKGPNIYFWDGEDENPYFGILGWADALIVTSESMSMVSEAATTGKPVYTVNLNGSKARHRRMQENLREKGIIRNFEGQIDEWTYEPLNDAGIIAEEIRRKSGLF